MQFALYKMHNASLLQRHISSYNLVNQWLFTAGNERDERSLQTKQRVVSVPE